MRRCSWCAPGPLVRPPSSSRSRTRCSRAWRRGELPPTLRVYRPAPAVAFGKLDTLRPGYAAAVEAARAHGYEPVLRLPGGHAAAYHADSLAIDVVWALDDPVVGTHDRFRDEGERLAGALRVARRRRARGGGARASTARAPTRSTRAGA